jgi:hypothetical protein
VRRKCSSSKSFRILFLLALSFFSFGFEINSLLYLVACEFSERRVQVVGNRLVFLLFTEQIVWNRKATPLVG